MKIRVLILFTFFGILNPFSFLYSQKRNKSYDNYIQQYNKLAIDHMKRYKIPASITLAQAILESGAGLSSFAKESNNHFGIKCHSDWKGKRVYRKDDGPNDCFRKYKNVSESYEDHSRFLAQRSRYESLFRLNMKDYKGWAKGLQKCGYATDKAYANKLIKIIETYELYQYDENSKKNSGKNNSAYKTQHTREIYKTHGLIYVIAGQNDSFESIAHDLGFKLSKLISYNEVPRNFPLNKGDIIYLEKKKKKADKPYSIHTVQIGESMHGIAQRYGIQLSNLYKMNKKDKEYIPEEGDILKLR